LRIKPKNPEYTKDLLEIPEDRLVTVEGTILTTPFMDIRDRSSPFHRKAIYLSDNYDWVLGLDDDGRTQLLVPLKKLPKDC
jgi:hypothetical protein